MTINHQFTKEELDRLDAYCWCSPKERREIVKVYESILRKVEDEEIRKSVTKLLNLIRNRTHTMAELCTSNP